VNKLRDEYTKLKKGGKGISSSRKTGIIPGKERKKASSEGSTASNPACGGATKTRVSQENLFQGKRSNDDLSKERAAGSLD